MILACRNEESAAEAAVEIKQASRNKNVVVRKMDLASFQSVKDFATKINEGKKVVMPLS